MVNNNAFEGTNPDRRTYAILLIGILGLAFTAPWVKLSNFEPATSALLRVVIGGVVLIPFAIDEYKKKGGIGKTGILLSLVAGFFMGIDFTAWNYSIYYVGSGIASVLLNLQVIILPALAAIFDRGRIPKSFYILAPIMIIGVIMTGGLFDSGGALEGPDRLFGMDIAILGTIAGSISGISYGIYLFASRKAGAGTKVAQPIAISSIFMLIAPVIFMIFFSDRGIDLVNGVMVDGVLPANAETAVGDPINTMNWVWMIVLGTVGQAMTWTFVQYGSIRLNSTLGAGLLLLSPVSTIAIISPILFSEIPQPFQITGVVIVLLAVAYQNNLHKVLFKGKSLG